MAEYEVQAVAPQVREYTGKFGPMVSYKVKFTVEPDTVEISQKPETPAPKTGDILHGDIIDGQYGKKFKKEYNAGGFTQSSQTSTSDGTSKPSFQPRDDSHIKAQWAIGQAMTFHTAINTDGKIRLDAIESLAKELFAMVDRVKATPEATPTVAQTTSDEVLAELFPDVPPVDQGELPWNPGS